jgi:hypothetical protein
MADMRRKADLSVYKVVRHARAYSHHRRVLLLYRFINTGAEESPGL